MIVLKPVILCIITLIVSMLLKNLTPQYVPVLLLCCGVIIAIYSIPFIKSVVNIIYHFQNINSKTNEIIKTVIKIVIIAVFCEFASELCSDSQEAYLASKITFVGKIIIISMISPYVISFMDNVIKSINEI